MDHNILQNIFFLAKGIKKEHPKLLVLMGIEAVLSVVSPVFSIYIPKIALDLALQGADLKRILAVLGTIGLIMALSMALSGMAREGKYMLYNDMRRYYMMELFLRSLSCDYKYVESAQGQVKYQRAIAMLQDGDWSGTSILVVATMDIFVNTLCFFLYSCILAALSPYVILLLVVLSLVSLASMHHTQEYEHRQQDQAAEYGRKLQYVTDTGSDAAIGKDMRLYHTRGWFAGLRDGLIGQSRELTQKIQDRYFASGIVNAFLFLLRDGFSYTYLIWSVASGRITVPEFALYFGAITAFYGFVDRMVDSLDQLNGANLQMNFLRAYLDDTDGPGPEALIDMVDLDDVSIEFQDVCFSYEQGEPVLEHFDLKVSSGEKVALVGVNGAGKTTIVKLLCGFYQPDSGRILIGGQDISRFKKEDLQKLLAAVFQDIYIPPFSVAENVAMQESGQIDKSRVQKCRVWRYPVEKPRRSPWPGHCIRKRRSSSWMNRRLL